MILTQPATPLAYTAAPARGDSLFALIGLATAVVCAALPCWMAWQLVMGRRHSWAVYTPYAADIGFIHVGTNWPWFALDTIALLAGVVGLQRGRPRFAIAAMVVAGVSLVGVMTIVMGSPW